MADNQIIKIDSGNIVFRADDAAPVRGGHARFVPMVPIKDNGEALPCIWKSHKVIQAELSDGSKVPAYECLLMISKNPITTIRAEVAVESWQYFGNSIIEW